jgi:hypothetical protein
MSFSSACNEDAHVIPFEVEKVEHLSHFYRLKMTHQGFNYISKKHDFFECICSFSSGYHVIRIDVILKGIKIFKKLIVIQIQAFVYSSNTF